jgi:hypothetical protein
VSQRSTSLLFIFTDTYCFSAEASMPVELAEEYQPNIEKWFMSLEFVENGGK